jgi:hypothetical protein
MVRRAQAEDLSIAQALESLNLDILRPLGRLIDPDAPTRKQDLVPYLTRMLASEDVLRRLYESLDETSRAAVQEALASREGGLNAVRFQAKYGRSPNLGAGKSTKPLHLFLLVNSSLPKDMRPILKTFVPKPRPLTVSSSEEIPATVTDPSEGPSSRKDEEPETVPLRRRLTAPVAARELTTLLRLAESGKLKVSDKTRKPTEATVKAIAALLVDGDFYGPDDRSQYGDDPGSDLTIRAFAWPCVLQAAGLVSVSGGKVGLPPAGRKALGRHAHEVIRNAWENWLKNDLFDEFERIEAIKGKKAARLTAPAVRRQVVNDALAECPPGRWIAIDEFFRIIRAADRDFSVAREVWKLYIAESYYGSFEYDWDASWGMLEGRFILAMLFEYAATLGLIDVAYIAPQGARLDYDRHWGTDDYECLSRYDGLEYVRVNALGAWCLGLTEDYQPEPMIVKKTWKVLPNHDVVSSEQDPDPGDVLFLERVAEKTSERVWRLDRDKILTAAEAGLDIEEIDGFLEGHSAEPIPATVATLLDDLRQRAGLLRDKGTVRMIECADAETARLLLVDSKLKSLCLPAGDRNLVFREADQAAVRARLRKLGYVVPSGG